ncbi:MAG: UDPGP type 1 family protein [Gemmataceae bacterium]|nr:UDPGP type 1 family protein [Gemmataceae bacterium]MDW8265796.1 UDPGP type 1 family protein [Gemmataceae bacterium]
MEDIPQSLKQRLHRYGQEHVLAGWDSLSDSERRALLAQLEAIDFDLLHQLFTQQGQTFHLPDPERITPLPRVTLDPSDLHLRRRGEEALRRGEVAVLIVAGGQGSRLGFVLPKGMFPIGPVSQKTLFQVHAEKVLALRRRYGAAIPLLIMTSPATDDTTRAFFADQRFFGLPPSDVFFFCQGTMPALDIATGRLLLEKPGRIFTSPDGHGGTLAALRASGLLHRLRDDGIRHVFYFQVDNPLVRVADPLFLGHHLAQRAEVSSKVVAKNGPTDTLGNFLLVDGRCTIIEYSDLPETLARQTDAQGRLRLWAGNPAIHIFDLDFLERMSQEAANLPFHVARKKVPCLDASGQWMEPTTENALKFERFIFDVLPRAERWTAVETTRATEFVPLKRETGPESPPAVQQALSNLFGGWLKEAGVAVPRRPDGDVAVPVEISPLFALDADELRAKLPRWLTVEGALYLE